MSLSISSHFGSGDSLAWPEEDISSFPLFFLVGSSLPLEFPTEVKFSSTSRASTWSWSKVRDFLSLRVKQNLDSKAPTNTTREAAWGGFISPGRLLYYLLNVFMSFEISSFGFFLIALNSVRTYSWFLFSPHICVKEFSSSSQVVMEELGRDLNHFLASLSRDCTKSLRNTSSCSAFIFSAKARKVSMCLYVVFSSSPLNLGKSCR